MQLYGNKYKSFLHATDLAKAVYLVSEKGNAGEIYNVGPEDDVSMKQLVEMVQSFTGVKDLYEMSEERFGEDDKYWLDSAKIRGLGWKPEISLDEGIRGVVEWGKCYLDTLKKMPVEYTLHR